MISISKAEHLVSFWNRGPGELGNGLFVFRQLSRDQLMQRAYSSAGRSPVTVQKGSEMRAPIKKRGDTKLDWQSDREVTFLIWLQWHLALS